MFGWDTKPYKVKCKGTLNGKPTFDFQGYTLTIDTPEKNEEDDENPILLATKQHGHGRTDPRNTLENMSIEDGVIKIPISDLVGEIMSRCSPADIAHELWTNQSVREQMIFELTSRWSDFWTDDERRKIITDLKEVVHNVAVDRAANAIAQDEHKLLQGWYFFHEVMAIRQQLSNWKQRLASVGNLALSEMPKFETYDNDPMFKIGGQAWNETRDYWRAQVSAAFPPSEKTP